MQLTGAVLILAGFALAQARVLDQRSARYLGLNAVGSGLLAATALVERQWGFVLLNVTWGVIAIVALARGLRRRARGSSGDHAQQP